MNKWQSIHHFWESFGIPAYDENSVPDKAVAPYITYSAEVGSFEQPLALTGSIWYRSTSWKDISNKADEVARAAHCLIRVTGGYLFITRGSPFAKRVPDEDDTVKRIYINLMAEFFTDY